LRKVKRLTMVSTKLGSSSTTRILMLMIDLVCRAPPSDPAFHGEGDGEGGPLPSVLRRAILPPSFSTML
jgi:hypothetical protein